MEKYIKLAKNQGIKMRLYLYFSLLYLACSSSLVSILGMDQLLQGLVLKKQSTDPFGDPSTAYMLDPNVNVFLVQFRNRTQFCDYKCKHILSLPCFLLFGCNIQIRNFLFILVFPIITIVVLVICCVKRFWTFKCWLKYAAIFSGFNFFVWAFTRCRQAASIRKRKLQLKKKEEQINKKTSKNNQNYQIQPPQSLQRMNNNQISGSKNNQFKF